MDDKALWAMDQMERGLVLEDAIKEVLFGGLRDPEQLQPSELLDRLSRAVIWLLEKNVETVDELNSLSLAVFHEAPYHEINHRFFKR